MDTHHQPTMRRCNRGNYVSEFRNRRSIVPVSFCLQTRNRHSFPLPFAQFSPCLPPLSLFYLRYFLFLSGLRSRIAHRPNGKETTRESTSPRLHVRSLPYHRPPPTRPLRFKSPLLSSFFKERPREKEREYYGTATHRMGT